MAKVLVEFKGCKFSELYRCPVPVNFDLAWGKRKLTFVGVFTVDLNVNSWKYGDQLLFQVWTEKRPVWKKEPRVNDSWNRRVIAVPLGEAVAIRDALSVLIKQMRAILPYKQCKNHT